MATTPPSARPRASLQLHGAEADLFLSPLRVVMLALAFLAGIVGSYLVYARISGLNNTPSVTANTYVPAFTTDLTTSITTTGSVEATQDVDLGFSASGEITAIKVAVGDQVKAGQELARLDDTQLQASLRSAQANLASAQARLDALLNPSAADSASAYASVLSAQNQVTSAEQALSDLKAGPSSSDIATAQQGVLSAQNALQNAQDALSTAQDAVGKAEDGLNSAGDDMDNAWNDLKQARTELNSAEAACPGAPNTPSLPGKGSRADGMPFLSASVDCGGDDAALADYKAASGAYGQAASAYNATVSTVDSRQAALDSAQGGLNSGNLERSIESAQLGLQTATQKQQDALAGATPLEVSQAQGAIATAQAGLETAQARYDQLLHPANADVLPLQASVDSAADSVATAQKNLSDAVITAPFDGTISALSASVGDSASSSGAASSIMTLVNPKLIRITASVDQTDLPNLKTGQAASVAFDALSGNTYEATVSSVGLTPTVTQGVVTYTVLFAIDTSALLAGTPVPSPGMTATLAVTTASETNVLVVPSRSIQGTAGVGVVTVKGAAGDERRPVTTGITNGTLTQILSGLTEGEEVVYNTTSVSSSSTGATQNQQQNQFVFPGAGGAGGGGGFRRGVGP
jgi:HlyD family secretion protein